MCVQDGGRRHEQAKVTEYLFFVILTELVSKLVCQGALHVVAIRFKTVSRINAGLQLQQGNTKANEDMQDEATGKSAIQHGLISHKPFI